MSSPDRRRVLCLLCRGVCPECGGYVGEAAGSRAWILCSMCHATFTHTHDDDDATGDSA